MKFTKELVRLAALIVKAALVEIFSSVVEPKPRPEDKRDPKPPR